MPSYSPDDADDQEVVDDDPYTFDAAAIGHCPGCGTEVRMFSGGQWWVIAPLRTKDDWWCPACLKAKCVKAAEGIHA